MKPLPKPLGSSPMRRLLLLLSVVLLCFSQDRSVLASSSLGDEKKKAGTTGTTETTLADDTDANGACLGDCEHICACKDRVSHLPGWDQPLPSPWYSGYVSYEFHGRSIHTHYVLVLAEEGFNADDDDDDAGGKIKEKKEKPLIYWSNGGPGASSLFGLLTEIGPLLFDDDSLRTEGCQETGVPTPSYNRYSWTRLGHVLMFDQPAPVGFSYCNNATDDYGPEPSCEGLAWNDELTSEAALAALGAFYEKFPALRQNDLYLTGESYAGIYIPTLARRILRQQEKQQEEEDDSDGDEPEMMGGTVIPPLKGFAVGDGCLGTETGICGVVKSDPDFVDLWIIVFLAGHGQIPMKTFQRVMRSCVHHPKDGDDSGTGDFPDLGALLSLSTTQSPLSSSSWSYLRNAANGGEKNQKRSEACDESLRLVTEQVGGVYAYGLYDDCVYRNEFFLKPQQRQPGARDMLGGALTPRLSGALNDYTCGGQLVMDQYLRLPAVQKALHLRSKYYAVDNAEGFQYTPTEPDLRPFYREVAERHPGVRVLVYNGDTDPAINSFAAQNWTSGLGLEEVQAWTPWTIDGCRRMGGYVTRYAGDLDFLTIRGAGHMVPTFKAAAAFTFIQSWIENNGNLPPYNKDCQRPPPHPPAAKAGNRHSSTDDKGGASASGRGRNNNPAQSG